MNILPPNKMDTLSWLEPNTCFRVFQPTYASTKQQQRLVFLPLQSPLVDLDSTSRAFFFALVDSFIV